MGHRRWHPHSAVRPARASRHAAARAADASALRVAGAGQRERPDDPRRARRRGAGGGGGAGPRSRRRADHPGRRAEPRAVPRDRAAARAAARLRRAGPAAGHPRRRARLGGRRSRGHRAGPDPRDDRRRRRDPRRRRQPHDRRPGPRSGARRTRVPHPRRGSAPDGGDRSDRRRLRRRGGDRRARLRRPHADRRHDAGVVRRGRTRKRWDIADDSVAVVSPTAEGIDDQGDATPPRISRGWSTSTTPPGCRRSCAARTRRCISASRGRSGSTPASRRRRSRTRSTAATWPAARPASRWPSTSPPIAATTRIIRASPATWAWPASRSTRSRT